MAHVQWRQEQAVLDGGKMSAKFLARLFDPWPEFALANGQRHGTRKHGPPIEEVSKEARSEVDAIVRLGRFEIGNGPFAVVGRSNGKRHVDVVAAEPSERIVLLPELVQPEHEWLPNTPFHLLALRILGS